MWRERDKVPRVQSLEEPEREGATVPYDTAGGKAGGVGQGYLERLGVQFFNSGIKLRLQVGKELPARLVRLALGKTRSGERAKFATM